MITPRNVIDSSCSSCGGTKRVVEFKIGRGTTEHVIDGGGLLVRFCYDCRRSLERHLHAEPHDGGTSRDWPNTENVRARQAAGQPVSFLESVQARPREFDETGWKPILPDSVPACDLCSKMAAWKHPAGGYRCSSCQREWLLAHLESQLRVNHRGTRKKRAVTRKSSAATRTTRTKGIGIKARKKR